MVTTWNAASGLCSICLIASEVYLPVVSNRMLCFKSTFLNDGHLAAKKQKSMILKRSKDPLISQWIGLFRERSFFFAKVRFISPSKPASQTANRLLPTFAKCAMQVVFDTYTPGLANHLLFAVWRDVKIHLQTHSHHDGFGFERAHVSDQDDLRLLQLKQHFNCFRPESWTYKPSGKDWWMWRSISCGGWPQRGS